MHYVYVMVYISLAVAMQLLTGNFPVSFFAVALSIAPLEALRGFGSAHITTNIQPIAVTTGRKCILLRNLRCVKSAMNVCIMNDNKIWQD